MTGTVTSDHSPTRDCNSTYSNTYHFSSSKTKIPFTGMKQTIDKLTNFDTKLSTFTSTTSPARKTNLIKVHI